MFPARIRLFLSRARVCLSRVHKRMCSSRRCGCSSVVWDPHNSATRIEQFAVVRAACPAISAILVPDTVWPAFREWHTKHDSIAEHASVLVLAFMRGLLPRVTSPVHCYLMKSVDVRADVSKQYLQDLQENWMLESTPI